MNIRTYGEEPYRIAVVHAGPCCYGSTKGLAQELSKRYGVIELLQSAETMKDQVKELEEQVKSKTKEPVILIGHDMGAWLAVLLAAKQPKLVKKLILIGTLPLEEKYLVELECNREYQFTSEEFKNYKKLKGLLLKKGRKDRTKIYLQLRQLCMKSDEYQPLVSEYELDDSEVVNVELISKAYAQVNELRQNGMILEQFQKVSCPMCIMHGEYDTHPAVGVLEPLIRNHVAHSVSIIEDCGHTPWLEKLAFKDFFRAIYYEIETM